MAEALIKEVVCDSCGAEVRSEAQFCYNCGHAVSPAPAVETGRSDNGMVAGNALPVSKAQARTKHSLARRNVRAFNRRPVEIRWERPPEPSKLYVAAAITMSILALVLLILALYLR